MSMAAMDELPSPCQTGGSTHMVLGKRRALGQARAHVRDGSFDHSSIARGVCGIVAAAAGDGDRQFATLAAHLALA